MTTQVSTVPQTQFDKQQVTADTAEAGLHACINDKVRTEQISSNIGWSIPVHGSCIALMQSLKLTLPGPSTGVSGSLDSYCSLKPLCSGMGEVVPARTSPTLLPPSPRTVLSLSYFKLSQCINCRDWHCKS